MKAVWKGILTACALSWVLVGPMTGAHAQEHGEAHLGGHHEPHVEFFKWDMNAPPVGWLLFDFALFLFILVRFAGRPLKNLLLSRHEEVKKAIEEAAAAQAQALARAAEYTSRLQMLDGEIAALRAEFKHSGEATRRRLEDAGKRAAEKIAKDAQLTVAAEATRAGLLLQAEAASLAMSLAESMVKERLNAADHKKLGQDFVKELRN